MTPISTCSFCLRDRPADDLFPLGPEISKNGQMQNAVICQRCHERITPPDWVARDAICTRLWFADADWRTNARLATGHPETERLMVKLAWKTSGGSEGEAVQAS